MDLVATKVMPVPTSALATALGVDLRCAATFAAHPQWVATAGLCEDAMELLRARVADKTSRIVSYFVSFLLFWAPSCLVVGAKKYFFGALYKISDEKEGWTTVRGSGLAISEQAES